MVEMAERWQVLLEPRVCHSFQPEENKSICEAATGAERTFSERSVFTLLAKELSTCVCMCTCADERVFVCVCRCHFGVWLVGLIGVSVVIGSHSLSLSGYTQT